MENALEDEVNLLKTQKIQVLLILSLSIVQLNDTANVHNFTYAVQMSEIKKQIIHNLTDN